jgi:heme-degrading monooxygenase HmoA
LFHLVWEFHVRPGREAEFEERYGAEGDWVRLFRHGEGYGQTVLLRDLATAGRYLVTDAWRDGASYRAFQERYAEAYALLDARCAELTLDERKLGEFEFA